MSAAATPLRLLIVEDREDDAEIMALDLAEAGYDVSWARVDTETDFLGALDPSLDVVLADYSVPSFDTMRALAILQDKGLDVPFIIVSGTISEEAAVDCLKRGAADYLVKDRLHRLPAAVALALEQRRLRRAAGAAEEALRRSEARFRLAFDNAPIGMALVAPDGRWLATNPALCRIVGYTTDVLATKTFQDITHPDDLEADLGYVGRMLAGETETYSMEKRYFHALGHVVWVNLSVSLVRDEVGQPLYFISQIEDITDRKADEKRLRRSHDLLDRSQALAHVGSWEWDVTAGPGGGATWSKEMYRIHGADPDTFVMSQESVDALIHPEDLELFAGRLGAAVVSGNDVDGFTYRAIRTDGTIRWVWVEASFDRERPGILVGFAQDVTDWHLAQEELAEANAALRKADELKDQFLAVTAHELRTPLTAIAGLAEVLLTHADVLEPEERLECHETIHRQSGVLRALVEDLLTLSAIEAGKAHFDIAATDVASAVRQAVIASGLRGQVTIAATDRTGVAADPRRLEQMLTNYLTNARKHGSGPFAVTVSGRAGWVEVRVTDSGPGVPAEFVPFLFERFSQAAQGGNRARGCGLGLAIVASLAEAQGGHAWHEPASNGACFAFRLPAAALFPADSGEGSSAWCA